MRMIRLIVMQLAYATRVQMHKHMHARTSRFKLSVVSSKQEDCSLTDAVWEAGLRNHPELGR